MMHNCETYAALGNGFDERNDCAVRATALALCLDYSVVHKAFLKHGRKPRHRSLPFVTRRAILEFANVFPTYEPKTLLSQFVKDHNVGHYIVHVRGHLFALCDGVVFDWTLAGRRKVLGYWKVV